MPTVSWHDRKTPFPVANMAIPFVYLFPLSVSDAFKGLIDDQKNGYRKPAASLHKPHHIRTTRLIALDICDRIFRKLV